jgi:hypothetical protein
MLALFRPFQHCSRHAGHGMLDQTLLSGKPLCPTSIKTGSQRCGFSQCGASIFQHRIPNARFGSVDIGSLLAIAVDKRG